MSDLRGQVARAIATPMAEALGISADEVLRVFRRTIEQEADAAIAVVIEELAQRANAVPLAVYQKTDAWSPHEYVSRLADWLRAQQETIRRE